MSVLFKNAEIYSDGKFLKNAYLGVNGSTIDYIGEEAPTSKYGEIKDMSGKLLIPGLINTHTHSPMTLLRGAGTGLPLQKWLFEAIFPVEDQMTESDVIIGAQFAILEMLAGGTTCFEDMYWNYSALAPMILDSGVKVNAGSVVQLNDQNADWARAFADKRLQGNIDFYKQFNNAGDGRIHCDLQFHSEYLSNDYYVGKASEIMHEYNMPLHIHISETKLEHEECIERRGKTPIAYMNEMGMLDTGAVCAHCVWVSNEDLEIMAKKGATIAHNPTSNLKLGSGIAPIAQARSMGVNVTIGTDGTASNNNLNMFEEMHIASVLEQGVLHDPLALSAKDCFDMATVNGAKALHRPDTGVLSVGKKADIVAIDMDKPHLLPNLDTLALLVYSIQAADVCMTMVDGKVLYENGEYFTIDAEKCKAEYLSAAEKLWSK